MRQIRKFALALVALSVIAGSTVAASGIEVLVNGIEVLGPGYIAHTTTTHAPAGAMCFAVQDNGSGEQIVDMQPIAADGTSAVYFPVAGPNDKVVVGFLTADGIEVLAVTGTGLYEGIWELD